MTRPGLTRAAVALSTPAAAPPLRVGMVSLGCPKNQVDAELMLGRLREQGYELTADSSRADVVIVNTCGFIDEARKESIDAILETSAALAGRPGARLVVAGCLAQRHSAELAAELPEVSAFVPLGDVGGVVDAVAGRADRVPAFPEPHAARFLDDAAAPRLLTSAPGTAYLKISEGCDHSCSFCAIPSMRGRHRSRPADDVVAEASRLAATGVREVVLVAQDSSAYGHDLGYRHGLAGLLERLDAVSDLAWIRVMYAYPNTLDDATLDAMAGLPKVCRYLDLPLQHASARVLRAMRRGGSAAGLLRLVERARTKVPDLVLRTTFIVGFPAETEADFEALLRFTADVEFDRLGTFTYSHQEGTSAFDLGDRWPESVKRERQRRLMEQQAAISRRRNARLVGRRLEVLVEGAHPESEHLLAGRWRGQAPEVDGCVIITAGSARPGELAWARVTAAHEHDLVARLGRRPVTARAS